jgi:hypothetical protein
MEFDGQDYVERQRRRRVPPYPERPWDLRVEKYGGLAGLVPEVQLKETGLFDLAKVNSHMTVQEVGE